MVVHELETLYLTQLRDIYDAAAQSVLVLPKLQTKATSPALRQALSEHLRATKELVRSLKALVVEHGAPPAGVACRGMTGLLDEASDVLATDGQASLVDIAIVAIARRLEHYAIAACDSASGLARALGFDGDRRELERAAGQAENEDEELSRIAEELTRPFEDVTGTCV